MFGYVRPSLQRLNEQEQARFRAVYCGLCRMLDDRYGLAARFILNYDFTFLAVLLAQDDGGETLHRRCMAHPLSGRDYYPGGEALALAADCSVILAWWQLRDGLEDERGGKRLKYLAGEKALSSAYRRAREYRPAFDRSTQEQLAQLRRLEQERCASLDRPADAFALLLRGIGGEVADPVKRRVLEEMLYHLGRWIYLVDAADDLRRDAASGSYNPLIYRFSLSDGRLTEEARESLVHTLDHSIRLIAAAYELWDFGVWSPLIRAAVYEGLYCVGGAVLEGNAKDTSLAVEGGDKERL